MPLPDFAAAYSIPGFCPCYQRGYSAEKLGRRLDAKSLIVLNQVSVLQNFQRIFADDRLFGRHRIYLMVGHIFFLIHRNLKTSRIFSLNRIPSRCAVVLNSAFCKSSVVTLPDFLPSSDIIPAATKPRNEFIFLRADICPPLYQSRVISIYMQLSLYRQLNRGQQFLQMIFSCLGLFVGYGTFHS